MKCPQCDFADTRVIETRTVENGSAIRRRRECPECIARFTTYERTEHRKVLWILKKDGRREAFDRDKLIRGISHACEKLPVSLEEIEGIVADIERDLRNSGGEVSSGSIGDQVMEKLAVVNKVAYVRFASVYREFTDLDSFQKEIGRLLSEKGRQH